MEKKKELIIFILVLIIAFLLYDKATTKPKTIYFEQQPTVRDIQATKNRECLLMAENFFEVKRSQDIDLYSATWNEHYDESSGTCYVEIWGNVYDAKTGKLIKAAQQAR